MIKRHNQADPSGKGCESPDPLHVALNAGIVEDGAEAGVQDQEEGEDNVSVRVGAEREAQEDDSQMSKLNLAETTFLRVRAFREALLSPSCSWF